MRGNDIWFLKSTKFKWIIWSDVIGYLKQMWILLYPASSIKQNAQEIKFIVTDFKKPQMIYFI